MTSASLKASYPIKVLAHRMGRQDYMPEGDMLRAKYSGQIGTLHGYSDAHGLCYEVKFSDGEFAWFDPCELDLVS